MGLSKLAEPVLPALFGNLLYPLEAFSFPLPLDSSTVIDLPNWFVPLSSRAAFLDESRAKVTNPIPLDFPSSFLRILVETISP